MRFNSQPLPTLMLKLSSKPKMKSIAPKLKLKPLLTKPKLKPNQKPKLLLLNLKKLPSLPELTLMP